jgi:acetyltransferase-like isoleucine patch superfamily enzyme
VLLNSIRTFDLFRSAQFALSRLRGKLALLTSGIVRGPGLDAIGAPIINCCTGSQIVIGSHVMLISESYATALGVNHPVVLRTLAPRAKILIGDRVGISGGSICAAKLVEIGDGTMLGANVMIADTDFHSIHVSHRSGHSHPTIGIAEVRIGKCVWIGANATILKGVSIGAHSVIGAGSVVTRDIPENCLAAGVPCRVIRSLTEEESARTQPSSNNISFAFDK